MANKNTFWAYLKRHLTGFLPIAKNRAGKCARCGFCCQAPNRCLFLGYRRGRSFCSIYPFRFLACRKYPRVKEEFLTEETCGYRFKE